jgi:hypothetical protein
MMLSPTMTAGERLAAAKAPRAATNAGGSASADATPVAVEAASRRRR